MFDKKVLLSNKIVNKLISPISIYGPCSNNNFIIFANSRFSSKGFLYCFSYLFNINEILLRDESIKFRDLIDLLIEITIPDIFVLKVTDLIARFFVGGYIA